MEMKKCIIAAAVSIFLFVMAIILASKNRETGDEYANASADNQIETTRKAIQAVCAPTDFKETCVNSLMKASPNSTQPLHLIKLGFEITIQSIKDGIKEASRDLKAKVAKDQETKGALELCEKLMNDATDDLKKCLDHINGFSFTQVEDFVEDLRVWLSGSIAYQQTCIDTFEEIKSNIAQHMHKIFKSSQELTSNGLAMVTNMSTQLGKFNITRDFDYYVRKLLSTQDSIPRWVGQETRRVMATTRGGLKANVVVAHDGSGQYKSINEALNDVPKNNKIPFIIYIKQGVYNEKVDVTKKMTHVTFIGDGPTKTKITGSLNFAIGKVKTYHTATVGEFNFASERNTCLNV